MKEEMTRSIEEEMEYWRVAEDLRVVKYIHLSLEPMEIILTMLHTYIIVH